MKLLRDDRSSLQSGYIPQIWYLWYSCVCFRCASAQAICYASSDLSNFRNSASGISHSVCIPQLTVRTLRTPSTRYFILFLSTKNVLSYYTRRVLVYKVSLSLAQQQQHIVSWNIPFVRARGVGGWVVLCPDTHTHWIQFLTIKQYC